MWRALPGPWPSVFRPCGCGGTERTRAAGCQMSWAPSLHATQRAQLGALRKKAWSVHGRSNVTSMARQTYDCVLKRCHVHERITKMRRGCNNHAAKNIASVLPSRGIMFGHVFFCPTTRTARVRACRLQRQRSQHHGCVRVQRHVCILPRPVLKRIAFIRTGLYV